jgi:hypothetical protein
MTRPSPQLLGRLDAASADAGSGGAGARERNSQLNGNGNGECVTRTQWLTTHLAFGAVRTVAMLDLRLSGDKTKESDHWTEMSTAIGKDAAKSGQ